MKKKQKERKQGDGEENVGEKRRYGVQVSNEWSNILWMRAARFPDTLEVRTLPEE